MWCMKLPDLMIEDVVIKRATCVKNSSIAGSISLHKVIRSIYLIDYMINDHHITLLS